MLYFAYGSNMNPDRLYERVGEFYHYEYGLLKGYKLTFNKKSGVIGYGYATVEECPNSYVQGVIYALSRNQVATLDGYEGYPYHYVKKYLTVETSGGLKECVVYIAHASKLGVGLRPTAEYFKHIQIGRGFIDRIRA